MLINKFVIPLFIAEIIGLTIIPKIPTIHNATNIISNIWLCESIQFLALYGKNPLNIFEPSSGGSGIRLNTPNPIFIATILCIMLTRCYKGHYR